MDEWIYGARLDNNIAVLIGAHTKDSKINANREVPFGMSIIYKVGSKRISNFLLDLNSLVYIRLFNYSPKYKKFILYSESCAIETVDALFTQFEKDYNSSTILKALDTDYRLYGEFINKGFKGLEEDPHPEDLNKFSAAREHLSYAEKLSQQLGNRNDPIEVILKTLHCWDNLVQSSIERRKKIEKDKEIQQKKILNKKTILKTYSDPKSIEQQCVSAAEQIDDYQDFINRAKDATSSEIQIAKEQINKLNKFISDNKDKVTKEIDAKMSVIFTEDKQPEIIALNDLYSAPIA